MLFLIVSSTTPRNCQNNKWQCYDACETLCFSYSTASTGMYFWKSWLLASKTWIEVADNVTKVNKWTMSMSLIGHFLASEFQNSHFQDEATC